MTRPGASTDARATSSRRRGSGGSRGRGPGVVVAVAAVLMTGCAPDGFTGVHDMRLPGGADLGSDPYRVTVQFRNVLDLVPQSGVQVNDVSVGRVEDITLASDGRTARVTLAVNSEVKLPANAVARLRQTSVLGEKFVELAEPAAVKPRGELTGGAFIPVARTNRNPEIEEVFGALSLLLNGGGIAQISNITQELNDALHGNEGAARELLGNLKTFVKGLDEHRGEITRALNGVNKLAATLNRRSDQIDKVLTDLSPGLKALSEQRAALTKMLKSLDRLTGVAVQTVRESKDDLVADLRALEPTLRRLADAGSALPKAMQTMLTFPFPDAALRGIKGDYLNSYLNLDTRGAPTSGASADPGSAPRLPLPSSGGRFTVSGSDS